MDVLMDAHNPQRFAISKKWGASPPLHNAVKNRNAEIVKALLRRGASRSFRDAKQRTALDLARQLGLVDMIALLES
jgi:ankyrin repeat protein